VNIFFAGNTRREAQASEPFFRIQSTTWDRSINNYPIHWYRYKPEPLMALSAAGDLRPGIYAGYTERFTSRSIRSGARVPFMGLLAVAALATVAPVAKASTTRSPVNRTTIRGSTFHKPGMNAGPETTLRVERTVNGPEAPQAMLF
jgi:hypothetical protein